MKHKRFFGNSAALLAAVALGALTGPAAMAQQPPPGPGGGGGGFGGPRGGGGGFGFGGQFMRGGRGELTLSQVPLPILQSGLQLTVEQSAQVQEIETRLEQERADRRPQFGGPGGGGFGGFGGGQGGGGFDPDAMRARMEEMQRQMQEMQRLETQGSRQIEGILTPEQKTQLLPAKMREWKVIWQLNLPLETADALKLTNEQIGVLEKALQQRGAPGGNRPGGRQRRGGAGGGGGNAPQAF